MSHGSWQITHGVSQKSLLTVRRPSNLEMYGNKELQPEHSHILKLVRVYFLDPHFAQPYPSGLTGSTSDFSGVLISTRVDSYFAINFSVASIFFPFFLGQPLVRGGQPCGQPLDRWYDWSGQGGQPFFLYQSKIYVKKPCCAHAHAPAYVLDVVSSLTSLTTGL